MVRTNQSLFRIAGFVILLGVSQESVASPMGWLCKLWGWTTGSSRSNEKAVYSRVEDTGSMLTTLNLDVKYADLLAKATYRIESGRFELGYVTLRFDLGAFQIDVLPYGEGTRIEVDGISWDRYEVEKRGRLGQLIHGIRGIGWNMGKADLIGTDHLQSLLDNIRGLNPR